MSYILEALKKADQQRKRGTTPGLPAAQGELRRPFQPVYYGLFAIVLLVVGMLIGWLRPWQAEPPNPSSSIAKVPEVSPEVVKQKVQELPLPNKPKPEIPKPVEVQVVKTQLVKPQPADLPQSAVVLAFTELPDQIQREIPAMAVQMHAYTLNPVDRVVSINSHMLGEGGLLLPGLRLEQITPDGMIFSYKGYRFQRALH